MRRKAAYQSTNDELFKFFGTDRHSGLTNELFFRQKKRYGANRIFAAVTNGAFKTFFLELKKPLFFVMLVMCMVDTLIHFNDTGNYSGLLLLAALLLNAFLGAWQEWRSAKILDKIKHQEHIVCNTLRNGKINKTNDFQLVPGDLVRLSAGDKVPADMRLLESENLVCDEFVLFGSTEPKSKHANIILDKDLPLYRWDNCCFKGTKVIAGSALGLVYAIGKHTQLGQIKALSSIITPRLTPIESELRKAAIFVAYFLIFLSVPMLWINFKQNGQFFMELSKLFMGGHTSTFPILVAFNKMKDGLKYVIEETITLGSALMPIGLPLQLYLALLIALRKFPLTDVVFKKLSTIETLGSLTTVVLDKTGTMSSNEMVVQKLIGADGVLQISGHGYAPEGELLNAENQVLSNDNYGNFGQLLQAAALCTNAQVLAPTASIPYWHAKGEATDAAFATLAQKIRKAGIKSDKNQFLIQVFDFEPKTQRSSILWRADGRNRSFVKGSIEAVLAECEFYIKDQRRFKLDAESRTNFLAMAQEQEMKEFRVIALATRELDNYSYYTTEDTETRLDFVGLACLADPPHEDMPEVIKNLEALAMNVVVITGDSPKTTQSLAHRIGLKNTKKESPIALYFNEKTAEHLNLLDDEKALILGRASAENKYELIKELQQKGEVVAVIGDGVNDIAAIKQADVGVALGIRGADETMEVAQMTLVKDKLSFFAYGLAESKALSKNIAVLSISYLAMLFAEAFLGFADYFLPVTIIDPALIVLSDVISMTVPLSMLIYDKQESRGTGAKKNTNILSHTNLMLATVFGGMITLGIFAVNYLGYMYNPTQKSYTFLTFGSLILMSLLTMMYMRSPQQSLFSAQTLSNNYLLRGIAFALFTVIALYYIPFVSALFGSSYQSVGFLQWAIILGVSAVYMLILELIRFARKL